MGSGAVHNLMRALALGGITGSLLAASPFIAETAAEDSLATAPVPALVAGSRQPSRQHHKPGASSHTGKQDVRCSQIVPYPQGYYYGEACSDDLLVKLGESSPSGFSYGMLIVNGVYKCGYVQDGVVPIDHHPHKSAGYCLQVARKRIFNPHAYLKDLNCDPGDCSGGTNTKETPECEPEAAVYANFTTAQRSIFNVYPDGKSGFVGLEGEQPDTISYRGTVKQNSQDGLAAVVWGSEVSWGFTEQECVPMQLLVSSRANDNSPPIKLQYSLSANQLLTTPIRS